MKYKKIILFVVGMLSLLMGQAQGKPAPHRDGAVGIVGCLDYHCDRESGPVCGIDSSGFTRTFENRCLAELAYCREGRYYVEIKGGEC